VFAGFSTYDFVQHLDRQVHSITCSFIPGLAAPDASGASGCHATMMSPFSSVFRKDVWGGLPISLPAMSVFAFLLFRGVDTMVNRRPDDVAPRQFLVFAAGLPVLASLVMGYIALVELDAACKLCIGIYVSSLTVFVAAVLAWRESTRPPELGSELGLPGDDRDDENPVREHAFSIGQGVGFVAVPALVYLIAMPDYDRYMGACGDLLKTDDPNKVFVQLDAGTGARSAIEVVDPLCPSCRAFEKRLAASGLGEGMGRDAVLFPLDNACNWMVGSAVHPGACTVSEAVLCAEGDGRAVLDWAFAHQEEIRAAAAADPAAAGRMVAAAFPKVKSCLGTPAVKSKLNKSLRWVVSNQLPVLTPQFFVDGKKLCDADTDLGMDYALSRLLAPPEAP
jgi:uncharacterized membrane protein